MENQFVINAGIPQQAPPLHFGSSLSSPMMSDWQPQDCFITDYGLQYESALSSMMFSPVASNCNMSGEILQHSQPMLEASSCYSTPLNLPMPKSMGLNSSVADFSADPGFAERAAKFSCSGSRSFNGRTTRFGLKDNGEIAACRSNPPAANAKLPRISSSPAIKSMTAQIGGTNKSQDRPELANSQESTVSEQNPEPGSKGSNSRKRKAIPRAKPKETSSSPSPNSSKVIENGYGKAEEDAKGSNPKAPEPPKDYIHVRARRGQATDSHSLAERVRREKISERMKLLQNLVPGCNKVTGKALMLDEIINYVQSLQRQVEFLSMKLASVNTRLDFNMESLMSKDVSLKAKSPISNNNLQQHSISPTNSSAAAAFLGHQLNQFPATESQYPTLCEGNLETLVQMGFGRSQSQEMALQSQSFQGSNQVSGMKVEL